jgi:hypothetical protein
MTPHMAHEPWPMVHGSIKPFLLPATSYFTNANTIQWEFQDPKMEVLYHIMLYFVGIFPYIGLI